MRLHKTFYKNNHVNFILALVGSIGKSLIAVAIAFLLKDFIDIAIGGNMEDLKGMMLNFVMFLVVMAADEVVTFLFTNRFIQKGMRQYKEEVYCRVMDKDIGTFMKESTSDYISGLTNDAASIELNYLQGIFQIITFVMMFLAGLLAMAYLNLLLTFCVIFASLLPILVSVCFGKRLSAVEQLTSSSNASFVGLIKDVLSGFSVIKSFQAEKEVFHNFSKENIQVETHKKQRRDLIGIITVISSICGFMVNLVVFGFGSYLTLQGVISAGTVIAFIQLLNYIISPIEQLPPLIGSRKAAEGLIQKAELNCYKEPSETSLKEVREFKEAIRLRDVSFSYEKGTPVLSHITTTFKQFPENDIEEAVAKAGLKELLFQKGYEYSCGENGCALSGGEKQRISIARSLIKKTPILFMDEATAALDQVTGHMIEDAILKIRDLTSIIITHKLDEQLLRQYDRILVLHNGWLREEGTFDELYAKKDYFYSLYTIAAS